MNNCKYFPENYLNSIFGILLWRGYITTADTQGVNFEEVDKRGKREKDESIYSIRIFHIPSLSYFIKYNSFFNFEIIFWEG